MRDFGGDSSETVSPRFISEIAQARIEEIFHKVEQELARVNRSGLLPAGVVLTGGGVKLQGMVDMAKQSLRLPVSLGICANIASPLTEVLHDPAFTTAIGLVNWGFTHERENEGGRASGFKSMAKGGDMMKSVTSPLKKIFKSFLP
jgi:cell division protein FtsA